MVIVTCQLLWDRTENVKIGTLNQDWFLADGGVATHGCGGLSGVS